MTMQLRQKQLITVTVCLSVYIQVCMLLLNREEKYGHFSKFLFLFSTEDTGLKKTNKKQKQTKKHENE